MEEEYMDVKMTQKEDLRIDGTNYDLKKGDVLQVPATYATKMINLWEMAERASPVYTVVVPDGERYAEAGPRDKEDDNTVDDYMDRNASTVKAALEEDKPSKERLKKYLKYEKEHKDRKTVKQKINDLS